MSDKGIQYNPFDALKGFKESLVEKEQIKVKKPILAYDKLEELQMIISSLEINDRIIVEYYDDYKQQIKSIEGVIKKIDFIYKKITINQIVILINNILNIKHNRL